jgi:amino acid adenylation domain-containing protein
MTDLARAAAGLTPEQMELVLRRLAEAKRPAAAATDAIVPRPRGGEDPPLSLAQEQLWLLDGVDPGNTAFNILYPVRLRGPLDEAALERALDEVVRRHEALRTTFPEVDGKPVQRVHPAGLSPLRVEDLTAVPAERRDDELRARATAEMARRLDLRRGPLFFATLLRLGADDHALLLLVHHVVGDGWSLDVLFRELSALYDAFRRGFPSPLPEPGLQFADWAVWQRARFDGEQGRELLAWWRHELDGVPPVLPLPVDHPRPVSQVYQGAGIGFHIAPHVAEPLRAIARDEGATLFMVLLAVFDVLLHRWTGAEDFVVATPVANRTRVEAEGLIGYMINTLVVRNRLRGDPPFRALLRRVRQAVSGSFAHQELPFDTLVKLVRPELRPTYHPVFQVMLILQNATGELSLPGVQAELLPAERADAESDLTLTAVDRPDGTLWCGFEYASELFDGETIIRLARHFGRLAQAIGAAPDTRISALPLATDDEERLLAERNDTDAPRPRGACAHHLFEAQARATPEAVALRSPAETVTYGELDRRAGALARRLRARGVGPEARVAVCLDPSAALVVALLAVWKAGGAFVLLHPSDPPLRLRQIVEDADARLVIADPSCFDAFAGAAELLGVEMGDAEMEGGASPVDGGAGPRDLAYVAYVSGLAGMPDGVAVPHEALVNAAAALREPFDARPGDRWLHVSPHGFGGLALEMVSALASGAALVLPADDAPISGLLAGEAITHAVLQPSALAAMPDADLPALRVLCVAGEPCPAEVAERWAPGRTLLHLYGTAETIIATAAHLQSGAETPPIGTPISNLHAHVVDAGLRLLPLGVSGELCVGGVGIARGYLGRPALTAERFVPDPFSGIPGARLYRTGDVARWNAEGALEWMARADEQVKIRGVRVEPREAEAVLRAHPAVGEAAVVARESVGGGRRLVAYVVPAALAEDERHVPGPYGYERMGMRVVDDAALVASLRAHLAERLPEAMVPAVILPVAGLPRTQGGGPDRLSLRVLPNLDPDALAPSSGSKDHTEETEGTED